MEKIKITDEEWYREYMQSAGFTAQQIDEIISQMDFRELRTRVREAKWNAEKGNRREKTRKVANFLRLRPGKVFLVGVILFIYTFDLATLPGVLYEDNFRAIGGHLISPRWGDFIGLFSWLSLIVLFFWLYLAATKGNTLTIKSKALISLLLGTNFIIISFFFTPNAAVNRAIIESDNVDTYIYAQRLSGNTVDSRILNESKASSLELQAAELRAEYSKNDSWVDKWLTFTLLFASGVISLFSAWLFLLEEKKYAK